MTVLGPPSIKMSWLWLVLIKAASPLPTLKKWTHGCPFLFITIYNIKIRLMIRATAQIFITTFFMVGYFIDYFIANYSIAKLKNLSIAKNLILTKH